MSDLTENQRGQIIGLHKSGASYKSVSKTLGFPTTKVFRTVKDFKERDSVANLPRSNFKYHKKLDNSLLIYFKFQ